MYYLRYESDTQIERKAGLVINPALTSIENKLCISGLYSCNIHVTVTVTHALTSESSVERKRGFHSLRLIPDGDTRPGGQGIIANTK